jgi:hypothetical protein
MRERYQEGISVRFDCKPRVAEPQKTITVTARIFAPADTLSTIEPVLACSDLPDFAERPLKKGPSRDPGFQDYSTAIRARQFEPGNAYRLSLHLTSGKEPIAGCTITVLSKAVLGRARRRIRDLILGTTASGNTNKPSGRRRP